MKPTIQSLAFHMILLITFIIGVPAQAKDDPLKSANVLAFGPDNVLFVGDSTTGTVYAFDTVAGQNDQQSSAYNLKNIDAELASLLRTSTDNIQVKDLAVHPESKEAYIAVSRVRGNRYIPEIIIANQSGEFRRLDLAKTKHSKIQLGGCRATTLSSGAGCRHAVSLSRTSTTMMASSILAVFPMPTLPRPYESFRTRSTKTTSR